MWGLGRRGARRTGARVHSARQCIAVSALCSVREEDKRAGTVTGAVHTHHAHGEMCTQPCTRTRTRHSRRSRGGAWRRVRRMSSIQNVRCVVYGVRMGGGSSRPLTLAPTVAGVGLDTGGSRDQKGKIDAHVTRL